jgi:lambda family phage tail tape measure protein
MARQVSELLIRLGIEGYEGVDKLKGAFRDLDKVAQLSGRQIDDIRTRITNFGAESGRTEQLIRGQLEALRGLRTQAEFGSRAFTELTGDINTLQAELRGSTDAIERQREALVRSAGASNQNARAIERQIAGLERLRQQTRPGSSAFVQLSNDIQRATADLGRFKTEASQAANTLTQMPGASLDVIARQIGILQRRMQSLNISTQEFLRYQQRIALVGTVRSATVGRQELRATTAMYESPQYKEFVGERSLKLELPDTLAAIRFRINEINTELENISGYERRRQLTLELRELNRRLRTSVEEVTSQEDRAVAAIRRRIEAQRELNRTSGLREFFNPDPVERSIRRNRQKRLRQGILSEAEQANLQELTGNYVEALNTQALVARQSYTRLLEVQENYNRRAIDLEDKKNADLLASQQAAFDAELAAFDRRLARRDALLNRRGVIKATLGLGGRDLSPLYETIVGVGTQRAGASQQLMGRTPQQAVQDLFGIFGGNLNRTGNGTTDTMQDLQRRAIRYAGGSSAVQQAFASFAPGKAPAELYPRTGESGQAYRRRVEVSMEQGVSTAVTRLRNSVSVFGDSLKSAGSQLIAGRTGSPYAAINAFSQALRKTQDNITKMSRGTDPDDIPRQFKLIRDGASRLQQIVDNFGRAVSGASTAVLQQERALRRQAIQFSGNAPSVIEAFRGVRLGQTPTGMLPRTGESPAEYTARLGVGVGAEQFRLPAIPNFAKGTTRELQAVRQALQEIRLDLDPLAANFEATERRISRSVRKIDRELEGREGGRRRFSGMQFAQTAGAAISGGIFGGPEGLLGGVIGGIFGGTGGAFAGAAIGGQLGMFRQQLTIATDYAAQLSKLRISLRGVAGSAKEYEQALQATINAGARFNLQPTEATESFTRLAASVKGAGGTIRDTELAFNAITAAVKATGGNTEQVQGAMLALTQIFSKGKVSAEELNQIAERLPGTFTLFAKSAGKTGPELQKALQEGSVGLNDFMKFVLAVGDKYTPIMDKLASSSENAGERMKVSFANLKVAIGDALTPIGASIQNVTTQLIDMALRAARALKLVREAAGAEITLERGRDIQGRVGEAYRAVERRNAQFTFGDPRREAYAAIDRAFKSITPQAGVEGTRQNIASLKDLIEIQRRLGVGEGSEEQVARRMRMLSTQGEQLRKRLEDEEARMKRLTEAEKASVTKFAQPTGNESTAEKARKQAVKDAQVAAEQAQRRNEEIAQQEIRLADDVFKRRIELEEQFYQRRKELADLNAQNELRLLFGASRERAAADLRYRQSIEEYDRRIAAARNAVSQAQLDLSGAQKMAAITAASAAPSTAGRFPSGISGYITGDPRSPYYRADHGGSNYHEHLSFVTRAAAEAAYATLRAAGIQVTEFKGYGRVGGHSTGSAHYSGLAFDVPGAQVPVGQERALTARVQQLLGIAGGAGRQRSAVASQLNRNITDQGDILASEGRLSAENATLSGLLQDKPAFEKAAAKTLILDYTESLRQQNEELTKELRLSKERIGLQMEGYTEAYIELQLELNENAREQNKLRIDALTADKAQAAAIKDNLEQYRKQADLLREIYDLQENAKRGFGFREGARQYVESIGSMKEATAQLTTSGIKGLEESLFSLATTGTANFNQFASELLKQTARIILQQLVLKPLIQGLTSLFGGPATAASGVGSLGPAALNFGPIGPGISAFSANGNAFAANGIVPYAMGGIVQSPTLFRYANGGVPGTGLMGEAGPEAIIPLQRGRNGKLGVAGGGGTTNITVNVDASGTSANNDPGQAAALGRVISQAVQAELVKQKRPGGILSR